METKPIIIFISYSHENEIWLTQYLDSRKNVKNPKYLLDFWERSLNSKGVKFWYDRDEKQGIRGGDRWRTRIFEEIDNADIAILLITQDFVISPFIRDEELPKILSRSKEGRMEILPILLEPARLKDLDINNTFQITPGRPTPLCEYLETSESEWKKVRIEIIEAIENAIDRVLRKRNTTGSKQLFPDEHIKNDPDGSKEPDDEIRPDAVISETTSRSESSKDSLGSEVKITSTEVEKSGYIELPVQKEILKPSPPPLPVPAEPTVTKPTPPDSKKYMLIKDISGTETRLSEFGIVYNPYGKSTLEAASRDALNFEVGKAKKLIPWTRIKSVVIGNQNLAQVYLHDGEKLENVKLQYGTLVGTDSHGAGFVLQFGTWREIILPEIPEPVHIPKIQEKEMSLLIKDVTGTETKLLEFGIVYNSFTGNTLESSLRDMLIVEHSAGKKNIPWKNIENIVVQSPDDSIIKLNDGEMLNHVKLHEGQMIGIDESGFKVFLPVKEWKAVSIHRNTGDSGGSVSSGKPKDETGTSGESPDGKLSHTRKESNSYSPVIAVMVEDSTGVKTVLTEFGIVTPGSYARLEHASRDYFGICFGQGTKAVPWGTIKSVNVQSPENATIQLSDEKILKNVKPIAYCLVGKDENEFHFVFDFKDQLTITPLRETSVTNIEELVRDIPVLSRRADGPAYKNELTLEPGNKEYIVTLSKYYYNDITLSHTFRLPGPHSFISHDGFVELKAGGNFSIDRFPHETAKAIALKLNQLNELLSEKNEEKSRPASDKKPEEEKLEVEPSVTGSEVIIRQDKNQRTGENNLVINEKDGTKLVLIPEGKFWAGSRREEEGGRPFLVNLPAFYMAVFHVTNKQYSQFLNEADPGQKDLDKWIKLDSKSTIRMVGSGFEILDNKEDHPVIGVSWYGAKAYCEWAGLRLPNELEWEKGARGNGGSEYPWGQEFDQAKCRCLSKDTCSVHSYKEGISPWGLYHMIGNAKQWCEDEYDEDTYNRYRNGDFSIAKGMYKVYRGCSWDENNTDNLRCGKRNHTYPDDTTYSKLGFRCAKDM